MPTYRIIDGKRYPMVSGAKAVFVPAVPVIQPDSHTYVPCDLDPSCSTLCHWASAEGACSYLLNDHEKAGTA